MSLSNVDFDGLLRNFLTQEQYQAAVDDGNEILCIACAGSGKSRTLAYKIARLISKGTIPSSIVAFTFTEKAAESLKLRVSEALEALSLPSTYVGAMYIGTIHAYCQKILAEMDARFLQFDVLDENRLKLYLISRYPALKVNTVRRTSKYFERINEISYAWQILNDEMLKIEDVESLDPELGECLRLLDQKLDEDEFIDFSLMISRVVKALRENHIGAEKVASQVKYLMVDEYQDVNPSQERLIQELHKRGCQIFVVGDDDQAIYSWRGADVSNIIQFQTRYPKCARHTLSLNFRSTFEIVNKAEQFISAELGAKRLTKNPQANPVLDPKDMRTLWFESRPDEAVWVADTIKYLIGRSYFHPDGTTKTLKPKDFAVLMRSTMGSGDNPRHLAFSEELRIRNIPFTLANVGDVFDRPHVDVLLQTLELLRVANPDRNLITNFFNNSVLPLYSAANLVKFIEVMGNWGRDIHLPPGGVRRKIYPQKLLHDLLLAFNLANSNFDDGIMRDIGMFSKVILDVEIVYKSIDSTGRYRDILNFLQNIAKTGYKSSTDEILLQPDAVTISTVHGVKGLEFSVVFVVDVESNRFPRSKSSYRGWIPNSLMNPAILRGAYQSTKDEEARLFYTALTRAERFLFISGSANLGGKRQFKRSEYMNRLMPCNEMMDHGHLKDFVNQANNETAEKNVTLPTSFSEVKYYLSCPHAYRLRSEYGFNPAVPELFGFGKTIHTSISKLHEIYQSNTAPTPEEAESVTRQNFHLKHVYESRDPVNKPGVYENARNSAVGIIREYVSEFSEDFTNNRKLEADFEVPVRGAVLTGAIDLVLHENSNGDILGATVIDFKVMGDGSEEDEISHLPDEDSPLHWTELSLQVQLYAKAATEILAANAKTGKVHLLKSGRRIEIPVHDKAIDNAIANIEWAVQGILKRDFPKRPHPNKCENCDFSLLCNKQSQEFVRDIIPPPLIVPRGVHEEERMVRAFSEHDILLI